MTAGANCLVELLRDARPLLRLVLIAGNALRGHFVRNALEGLGLAGRPCRLFPFDVLNEEPPFLGLR